jgi:O-antigen biosynthesis protein
MVEGETTSDAIISINRPVLSNGMAREVVRGALFIDGWAIAPDGIATVEIDVDGQYVSTAHHANRHADAAGAFGDADARDFHALVPAWALSNGQRQVRVIALTKTGRRVASEFLIRAEHVARPTGPAVLRRKMPLAEIQMAERVLAGLAWRPNFGILIGIGEIDEEVAHARHTLTSLRDQVYGAWHATVLRRGRRVPEQLAARLTEGFEDIANRIDIRIDAPAAAPLADLVRTSGRGSRPHLIGVLLAGDVLGYDALLEMAIASGMRPDAEFFYSDERRISPASNQSEAFFKPQWSPDLLTATNYIGRFWCTLPTILRRARAAMGEWFQFGDFDLVLRCTEATSGICHIPKLLCERGRPQLDHPDQERAALARAAQRRGIRTEIGDGATTGSYRLKRVVQKNGLVSIVIPTRASEGRIRACLETLRAITAYRNFEIVCVENVPAAEAEWRTWLTGHADRVVTCDEPFNWSRFSNLGANAAKGEFLLFLNDDTEIVEPGWLDALLEHAERDEVGVVGARLLYPDGMVQHGGIFWTPSGGRHAFRGVPASEPGYFGLALTERDVMAVTGACFLVRRSEFDALGGFDEGHTIVNNDVDFCLRSWERGKSVICTPYATLIHHEGASRRDLEDAFDTAGFERRWGRKLLAGDPFYHPSLSRERDDYAADGEPLELVYPGRPLFDRSRINNILAVKLDHIGDFVTAIPALQRLQQHFPQARLYVLSAPSVAELSGLVPGLAGAIEFAFFFPRSGLGQRELLEADFRMLRQRLQPYHFDLAIDLRKAPETRPVLQYSGARWLAGFDHNGQFPWLDIVMEWETDPAGTRKRSHVSEDLLRLVDAVATACGPNADPARNGALRSAGPAAQSGRKIVCVHPGVGSPIRQWPATHFATLIDRLASSHHVEIILIGSDDEAEIAAEVMARVERGDLVRSLVGKIALRELPQLLASAALFVGNNSGPKHLAASLGVPTVGIHSGTVDAREWGPIGSNAVALRRDVLCSPCYFSDAGDCPRQLACLTELQPSDVHEICDRLLAVG